MLGCRAEFILDHIGGNVHDTAASQYPQQDASSVSEYYLLCSIDSYSCLNSFFFASEMKSWLEFIVNALFELQLST